MNGWNSDRAIIGFCWSPVFTDTCHIPQRRITPTESWNQKMKGMNESRYHHIPALVYTTPAFTSQLVEDFFCTARAILVDLGRGLFCDLNCFTSDGSSDPCRRKGHSWDVIQVCACTGCASESLNTPDWPTFFVRILSDRISQHLKMFHSLSFTGKEICISHLPNLWSLVIYYVDHHFLSTHRKDARNFLHMAPSFRSFMQL